MIKAIALGLALAFTSITGFASNVEKFTQQANTTHAFEFKQPPPKEAEATYNELVEAYKAGDANAIFFVDTIAKKYKEVLQRTDKEEAKNTQNLFIGCLAYQIGGVKALDSIDFVKSESVISGRKGETRVQAQALVDSWNYQQWLTAVKVFLNFDTYGADCWDYTHSGFTAGTSNTKMESKVNE